MDGRKLVECRFDGFETTLSFGRFCENEIVRLGDERKEEKKDEPAAETNSSCKSCVKSGMGSVRK